MPLITLVITLIIIGILLWVVNTQLGAYISPPILKIINVLVIVVVVLWLLSVLGLFDSLTTVRVPRLR